MTRSVFSPRAETRATAHLPGLRVAGLIAAGALLITAPVAAQVMTIDTNGNAVGSGQSAGTVDRRYMQITPTKVDLPKNELDPKTRSELIRFLEADQGFAMRPFPRGHKGLALEANGKLEPAGEAYLGMVTAQGLSAKPGDRLVVTDLKFEKNKIIFMINGGPDAKHRFLQHVQLGTGPMMNPAVQPDQQAPMGARLTLTFKDRIPELTGKQVEQLLSPLISFEVKTPIQAFTDTLPPPLKQAILDHHVLVGMSTDMVLFAKGKPESKIREMDGQMPFEEWIYGKPPEAVEFVRINGNRVIRVEVAKVGNPPQIFTQDVVEGMMRTDGTPVIAQASNTRTVQMGDVQRNPDTQAPAAPPSLRQPGESLPSDQGGAVSREGQMRPVQFPKQAPDDHPVAHQGEHQGTQPPPQQTDQNQQSSDHGSQNQTASQPANSQSATGENSTPQNQKTDQDDSQPQ